MARRLARKGIVRNVIPPKYLSATLKRAVTDLVLSLIDEIQSSFSNRYRGCVSLLTFDIQGAFDSVKKDHLVRRLH